MAPEYYEDEKSREAKTVKLSKTRKQGNAIVITIPEELQVSEGEEFYFKRGDNGTILLIPKMRDYFVDAKEGEFKQPLEWDL